MAGLAAHSQAQNRDGLPLSSQLGNAQHNYLVKRRMSRAIYSTRLFMSTSGSGLGKHCLLLGLFTR